MADASGNTLLLPSRNLCSRRGLLAATPALALAGGGAGGGGGGDLEPVSPAWRLLDAIHRTLNLDIRDPSLDESTIAAIDIAGESARDTLFSLDPTSLSDAVAMLLTLAAFGEDPLGARDVRLLLAVIGWLTRDAPHLRHPNLAGLAVREAQPS